MIGKKLEQIQKERKLKDVDILRLCGFTRPTLIKIKNDGNINVDTLIALAKGLGVPVGYFFDEEQAVETYTQTGHHNTQAHHIDKIEQNDNRGSCKKDLCDPQDNEALKNEVTKLKQELLEAKDEIIRLLKAKQ